MILKKKMIDTQEIREKTVHLSVYYLIGIVYTRLWHSG